MHRSKVLLLLINLAGGIAVLASYAIGFSSPSAGGNILWGGVPTSIRPVYTTNMFLAAIGYFAFTTFILFGLDAEKTRVADRYKHDVFSFIYAGILLPSALWLPLTYLAVQQPGQLLVWLVRLVLILVALASLGLLVALIKVNQKEPKWAHRLALIGILFFCFQTVILDATVWSILFNP